MAARFKQKAIILLIFISTITYVKGILDTTQIYNIVQAHQNHMLWPVLLLSGPDIFDKFKMHLFITKIAHNCAIDPNYYKPFCMEMWTDIHTLENIYIHYNDTFLNERTQHFQTCYKNYITDQNDLKYFGKELCYLREIYAATKPWQLNWHGDYPPIINTYLSQPKSTLAGLQYEWLYLLKYYEFDALCQEYECRLKRVCYEVCHHYYSQTKIFPFNHYHIWNSFPTLNSIKTLYKSLAIPEFYTSRDANNFGWQLCLARHLLSVQETTSIQSNLLSKANFMQVFGAYDIDVAAEYLTDTDYCYYILNYDPNKDSKYDNIKSAIMHALETKVYSMPPPAEIGGNTHNLIIGSKNKTSQATCHSTVKVPKLCYWAPTLICANTLPYVATNFINFLKGKPLVFGGPYLFKINPDVKVPLITDGHTCWHFIHEHCRAWIAMEIMPSFLVDYALFWAQEELLENRIIPAPNSKIQQWQLKFGSHTLSHHCLWVPRELCANNAFDKKKWAPNINYILALQFGASFEWDAFFEASNESANNCNYYIYNVCKQLVKYNKIYIIEALKLMLVQQQRAALAQCDWALPNNTTPRIKFMAHAINKFMLARKRPNSAYLALQPNYNAWPPNNLNMF